MAVQDLIELAERCEKATGPDRELDLAIHLALHPDGKIARLVANHQRGFDGETGTTWDSYSGAICYETRNEQGHCYSNGGYPLPAVTGSLDAAMTLVPEGAEWEVTNLYGIAQVNMPLNGPDGWETTRREDGNVILAFVECCLRARASLKGEG